LSGVGVSVGRGVEDEAEPIPQARERRTNPEIIGK
jgi:hypothetical protein